MDWSVWFMCALVGIIDPKAAEVPTGRSAIPEKGKPRCDASGPTALSLHVAPLVVAVDEIRIA